MNGPRDLGRGRAWTSPRGFVGLAALLACLASFASARGGPDTSPPVVAITSPKAGDTLTDVTAVSATATDDTAVVGVQFLLDGQPLGREVTAAPYRVEWSIAGRAQSGFHRLSAVARDAAGNTGTAAPVEVDVQGVDATHQGPHFKSRPLPAVAGRLGMTAVDWFVPALAMVPVTSPTATQLQYVPFNRDPALGHDRVWYRGYHPDWVMYRCDRVRPASLWGSGHALLDITNPEVRDYQLTVWVRHAVKRGLAGVYWDNLTLANASGAMCGHYARDGAWVPRYSGAAEDPAWLADIDAWVGWMRERIHGLGGLMVAGISDREGSDPSAALLGDWYDRIAAKLDAVLAGDGGFVRDCAPRAGPGWRRTFDAHRRLVEGGRGLMIQDVTCDSLADMTAELRSWMFANYLLVRGEKTYVTIVPRKGLVVYDGAEYYLPIGAPAGEPMQDEGGVWTRRYQHGLVAVNPAADASAPLRLGSATYVDIKGARVSGGQLFNGPVVTGVVAMPPASGLVLLERGIETLTPSVSAGRAPLAVTFTGYLVNGTPACGQTDVYSLVFGDGAWDFVTVPAGVCGPHRYAIAHTYAGAGAFGPALFRASRALPARSASIPLGHASVRVTTP